MKLVTKALLDAIKKAPPYCTDGTPIDQKKVLAKFFTPDGQYTWYVFEGEVLPDGDIEFFGWVTGDFPELAYFRLSQIEALTGQLGLPVERDKFPPARVPEYDRNPITM